MENYFSDRFTSPVTLDKAYNRNAGVGSRGVAALITVRMMQQFDIFMYSFCYDCHAVKPITVCIPATETNYAYTLISVRD